ncbi:uncharacterized protein DMAD_09234 [Drosophila madeirensis]|uniref:Solute-binding protein family 3/N-terminal domain-containing protein n=1 Tax=Drosophila madeirensis TaxID=30013 RepID=A0AAU9F599_DROMD
MSAPKLHFLGRSVWAATLLLHFLQLASGADGFGLNLMAVNNEDRSEGACILALLRKYFDSGDSLSGSVLCISRNYQLHNVQERLLRGMNLYEGYPWTLLVTNPREESSLSGEFVMHEKPQCYFLMVGNLEDEDLDEVFDYWKGMLNWNPLAQFVVYLAAVEETDEEMTDLMVELLLTFMNKKIFNVNVIGQSEENEFYYGKSVFPYHPDNNCGNRVIAVELLDACDYPSENGGDTEYEYEEEDGSEGDNEGDFEEAEENGGEEGTESTAESEERTNKAGEDEASDDAVGGDEVAEDEDREDEDGEAEDGEAEDGEAEDGEAEEQEANNDEDDEHVGDAEENSIQNDEENTDNEMEYEENDIYLESKNNFIDNKGLLMRMYEYADQSTEKEHPKVPAESSESSNDLSTEVQSEQSSKEDQAERSTEGVIEEEYEQSAESGKEAENGSKAESDNEAESGKEAESGNEKESGNAEESGAEAESGNEAKSGTEAENNKHSTDSGERQSSANATAKVKAVIEEFYRAKFEDKFPSDLSGCPLTAAFRPWEPYIFRSGEEPVEDYYYGAQGEGDYNETSSYGEPGEESYADAEDADTSGILDADAGQDGTMAQLSGIEYQMVQTIAERLNMNIDMQAENSNLYHLFQQLIDGEIEMIVGGIDEDPSISQFVSSSIPYHQDDLTWCVARAKRKHGFFNFVATFNADTGFLLLLFIVTCSLVVLMAQRLTGFRLRNLNNYFAICLRMLGILLTQAMPAQSLSLVLRQLFALSFLMGFIFSNTYQSFLISTLTTPRSSHQIESLEEIYSHRMIIMGSSENVRHLNKEGEIFKYIREKFQMCYNIVDCLNDAANNEHIAVAVSRQHSFYNPRIPRDRLFCFDRRESLYVYLVTMLLPKKYHLLHQINPIIQHIIESGHMQKWARDLDMKRMIHEEINRVREYPFKALTLAQFHGAFAFSSGLLLISFGVFLIEWAYVKFFYARARR